MRLKLDVHYRHFDQDMRAQSLVLPEVSRIFKIDRKESISVPGCYLLILNVEAIFAKSSYNGLFEAG